jgi:hypothetical protein
MNNVQRFVRDNYGMIFGRSEIAEQREGNFRRLAEHGQPTLIAKCTRGIRLC